jgi:excisionase family DNA binding protein
MKGQLNDTELPPLLSIDQACTLLGVSRGVGYRAAASGDLPTLRWGRRLYVPTARLLAMLGLPTEEKAG